MPVAVVVPVAMPPSSHQALLGREEAVLRQEFGDALQPRPIESRSILHPGKVKMPTSGVMAAEADEADDAGEAGAVEPEQLPAEVENPFAEQLRLIRKPDAGDVQSVEYELFRGRVYRVRWRLADRFERSLMIALVPHLTTKLGKPYYDQTIVGKFGTGRATLRRAGWRHESRSLEIRQLNPQLGGPIFLTLSDQRMIRAIAESGGTAAPEPDSIGVWWQKPIKPFAALTAPERDALLAGFDGVLAEVGWPSATAEDPPAD